MTNPEVTIVSVGTTPSLIFSGCGKVQLVGSSVYVGDANLNIATPNHWALLQSGSGINFIVEFEADAEIYAATSSGTQTVRVVRWF